MSCLSFWLIGLTGICVNISLTLSCCRSCCSISSGTKNKLIFCFLNLLLLNNLDAFICFFNRINIFIHCFSLQFLRQQNFSSLHIISISSISTCNNRSSKTCSRLKQKILSCLRQLRLWLFSIFRIVIAGNSSASCVLFGNCSVMIIYFFKKIHYIVCSQSFRFFFIFIGLIKCFYSGSWWWLGLCERNSVRSETLWIGQLRTKSKVWVSSSCWIICCCNSASTCCWIVRDSASWIERYSPSCCCWIVRNSASLTCCCYCFIDLRGNKILKCLKTLN